MAEREVKTSQFMSGQQSNAKEAGPTKTVLKSNVSKMRNAGNPDPLSQALKGRDGYVPSGMHTFSHSKASKPGGAHYSPAGEFGKPKGNLMSKATNPMAGSGGKGTFRGKP